MNERVSLLFYFCAFGLVSSLLLGGGTRGSFLSDALLQLVSLPVLLVALWRIIDAPLSHATHRTLALAAAVLAVPLAQLLPLPPALWTRLPGRETMAAAFELIGRDLPWARLSMSPSATWVSALSLLPPLALFLGVLQLNHRERRWLSLVMLAVGLASVFLALMQVAQGAESPLRFFEYTNPTESVGFFANRNHFAALLYTLMLFAAAWAADGATTVGAGQDQKKINSASIVVMLAGFCVFVALLAAQAMARSRGGLALTMVALLGALALAQRNLWGTKGVSFRGSLIAAIVLVFVFSTQFALYRIMERFEGDPLADGRIAFTRNTTEAAMTTMPFGAGLGAFVPVYAMFEKPRDLMIGVYANHAHNDFLELWLETGVVGPILLGVFAFWLIRRSAEVWRRSQSDGPGIDLSLTRAATLIIALLLAHSVVDYPLRTGAMMAVFAVACALLIDPPPSSPARQPAPKEPSRIRSAAPSFGATPQTP